MRVALLLIAVLIGYTASIELFTKLRLHFFPTMGGGLSSTLVYCLSFWMLGLLWLAYRRWVSVAVSDEELERLFAGMQPDVFLVVSPDLRILMCNAKVREVFGYEPPELLGRPSSVLYGDRRPEGLGGHPVREQVGRIGFHVGRAQGMRKDGGTFPLEIVTGALQGRRGVVVLLRDVSDLELAQRRREEKERLLAEIEIQYSRLKELEEARDEMVHMIVHDMKTPLQVIMGMLDIMKSESKSDLVAVDRKSIEQIQGYAGQLLEMTRSQLDVSRLQQGRMPLNRQCCDIMSIIQEAVEALGAMVRGRHLVLPVGESCQALCDPSLTQRILLNLLTNSVRYTGPGGRIVISCQAHEKEIEVSVEDTGVGIDPSCQESVFGRFIQAGGSDVKGCPPRTGIGLSFCKLAVEAQDGRIGLNSVPGKGSTFWFTLPRVAAGQ